MTIDRNTPILVTGANGFLGSRVVASLLAQGFTNIRGTVRPTGSMSRLEPVLSAGVRGRVELLRGNLLNPEFCRRVARDVAIVLHGAAGIEKTFPGCFMNSVVTTRNLLEAVADEPGLRRFVNVSSLAVYSTRARRRREVIDETCELESQFMRRFDAYCYGKTKQDQLVMQYGRERGLPWVIVRPGPLYGPGAKSPIHSRVGIGTFGIFLHLGGGNRIPLAYIDNCADAVVLAGITPGIEGEVFNVVDDNPPTSREFLRRYKREVASFRSLRVPYWAFLAFCGAWERYARWSQNQLPPAFNPLKCAAEWRGNPYSNRNLKAKTGWTSRVSTADGMDRHFAFFRGLNA